MADITGERLGPFEIRSLVGTGGFATVYQAHDPRLNSDVGIKLLAENHSLNPTMRERFISEAHALRRVTSPAVISIFDIQETDDGRPYLVLEYADRGTLASRRHAMATNGRTPSTADVLVVVDALADALDAIHSENLVHRDVTPANLLLASSRRRTSRIGATILEPDERLLLSDMGLVKDLSDGDALTIGGGTAGFWSPEQRGPYAKVDGRSDLWAATAVIVWLITGAPPSEDADWSQRVHAAGFGEQFIDALARGLSVAIDDRPSTAVQWQTLLHQAIGIDQLEPTTLAPVGEVAPTPDPPTQENAQAPTRIGPRALAFASLVAVGFVALLVLRGGALNPDSEARPSGMVAVTTETDDATLTIVGPERFLVGETVVYRAELDGATALIWTDPAGVEWSTEVLEVTASSPGRGTVVATVRANDGQIVRSELQFEAE